MACYRLSSFMRKSLHIAVTLILMPNSASASSEPFFHPGLVNGNTSLWTLTRLEKSWSNKQVLAEYHAAVDGKNKIEGFSFEYQAAPQKVVKVTAGEDGPDEKRWRADMFAAYYNAIRWAKSGHVSYRKNAIDIMNGWAHTFQDFKNTPNKNGRLWEDTEKVEASWAVPIWANTAEIILHYKDKHIKSAPAWADKDIRKFRDFLMKLHKKVGNITCTNQKACWNKNLRVKENNQALSASLADMAIGVFNNDRKLYDAGISRVRYLLPKIIYADGEVKELRDRDCVHPQYSLIVFTQAAQIEVNQTGRSDILSYRRNDKDNMPLLAQGIEYMARTLNESGPNSSKKLVRNCYDLKTKKFSRLRDGFGAMAASLYEDRERVDLPQLKKAMSKGAAFRSGLFVDLTDITHGKRGQN